MVAEKILVLFVVLVVKTIAQNEGPTVTIPDGKILGAVNSTVNKKITFHSFRGIPYAKPPIGYLRFSDPVKNDPWNGTFNATVDGNICPQMAGPLAAFTKSTVLGSEDCLHVNVYTTSTKGSLPVMLWVHGGAFQTGSNSIANYPPDYFLEKGVIFVAINYRLSALGFLSVNDGRASGNWGLKDQLLALKWVKNNIKYFGGDPEKITIFGDKSGAASVSYLVQSKQTKGLFNAAILQGGSSLCQWALSRMPAEKAWMTVEHIFKVTFDGQTLVNKLREVNYTELKLADEYVGEKSFLSDNNLHGLPWGPVKELDNVTGAFFTKSSKSWEQYSRGDFQQVPLLIGFNSNENVPPVNFLKFATLILKKYDFYVERFAPIDLTNNGSLRRIVGAFVRNHYFGTGTLESQGANILKFINFDQFLRPIREQVVQASKYVNVYYYKFSYKGSIGNPDTSAVGAEKGEELNYLFNLNNSISSQGKTVRERLVTLWTNFAKTGNPTPDPTSDKVLDNTVWTANNATTNANSNNPLSYLNIGSKLTVSTNPNQEDWIFYQNLFNKYGSGDYTTY